MEIEMGEGCEFVRQLVEAFGGISPMAKALGHDYPSTVQGWKERGVIPRWRINEIRDTTLFAANEDVRRLIHKIEIGHNRLTKGPVSSLQSHKCVRYVTNNDILNPDQPIGCRYIEGDPKQNWSYCNAKQQQGSPYCPTHHALCRLPPDHRSTLTDLEGDAKGAGLLSIPDYVPVHEDCDCNITSDQGKGEA